MFDLEKTTLLPPTNEGDKWGKMLHLDCRSNAFHQGIMLRPDYPFWHKGMCVVPK